MTSYLDLSTHCFADIAEALAATPHSRRMTGYLLRMCPDIQGTNEIARACASPEFAAAVFGTGDPNIVCELMAQGKLPASDVRFLACQVMKTQNVNDRAGLMALGSPLLRNDIHALLRDCPSLMSVDWKDDKFRTVARNAIWGNPLWHKTCEMPIVAEGGAESFLENAALFGNLENPNVALYMTSYLGVSGREDRGEKLGRQALVQSALLRRDDLPENIVLALDASQFHTVCSYRLLVAKEAHQKLVKTAKVEPSQLFLQGGVPHSDGEFVVSPAATQEYVWQAFTDANPGTRQDSLLLAKQCPERFYIEALAAKNPFLNTDEFARHSPWAEHRLRIPAGNNESGVMATLRAAFQTKAEGNNPLKTLCLPVIPFQHIEPDAIKRMCEPHLREMAFVVGAIRSRQFAEKLVWAGACDEADIALVFSPHTSGRQLDRLAGQNPTIAAWVACHPNGVGISLSDISDEDRIMVEETRKMPVLSGKNERKLSKPAEVLVI